MINRRRFLIGALAMPAIVPVTSLMPLRGIILPTPLSVASLRYVGITDDQGQLLGGLEDFAWRHRYGDDWPGDLSEHGTASHVTFEFAGMTMRVPLWHDFVCCAHTLNT